MRRFTANVVDVFSGLSEDKKRTLDSSLINEMLSKIDLADVLENRYGIYLKPQKEGQFLGHCPFPDHRDNKPSFSVSSEKGLYRCWGCLEENELIWSESGLKLIKDIKVGENVLDINGNSQKVIFTSVKKNKNNLKIGTSVFRNDPLILTSDHICMFVKKEDVKSFPYIKPYDNREMKFISRRKKEKNFNIKIHEDKASALNLGDYILFPVILERRNENIISSHADHFSIKTAIKELHVNCDTARLYGLWIAEGYLSRDSVCFSFHTNEQETLAKFVIETLKNEFNLKSILKVRTCKNLCEVICCSKGLHHAFKNAFGCLSSEKNIPQNALRWDAVFQKELIRGYKEGYAGKILTSSTVSKKLAYGLFLLSVQCQNCTSLSKREFYKDKNNIYHKSSWQNLERKRESCSAFYQSINNQLYYCMRVDKIENCTEEINVVDIGVENTNSFLTKLGAVHNCDRAGTLLQFLMQAEGLSFPDALRKLGDISGVAPKTESDRINDAVTGVQQLTENYAQVQTFDLPGGMSDSRFLFSLAERLAYYEKIVEYDSLETAWTEEIYRAMDEFDYKSDYSSMTLLWNSLDNTMQKRLSEFRKRKPK